MKVSLAAGRGRGAKKGGRVRPPLKGRYMDYRNEMRRDPYARGAFDGRYSPTFAPGAENGVRGASRIAGGTVVPAAVQQAIDTLPLAMVYVPRQKFTGIKDVAGALDAGTVFDALDMPFTGCRARGGRR